MLREQIMEPIIPAKSKLLLIDAIENGEDVDIDEITDAEAEW